MSFKWVAVFSSEAPLKERNLGINLGIIFQTNSRIQKTLNIALPF